MKIVQLSLGKELKIGMPNYSSRTIRADITFTLGDGEEMDWKTAWGLVTKQVYEQAKVMATPDELKFRLEKLLPLINNISIGSPILIDEFEDLYPKELEVLQYVKRAYNRSDLAKSKQVEREGGVKAND